MKCTFEQLPELVSEIYTKIDKIEQLLNQKSHQETRVEDELLDVNEAAAFLKLKVPTVYNKVCRSEIPSCKRGKMLYFSKNELAEWVKSGRKLTHAELQQEAENYCSLSNRGGKR